MAFGSKNKKRESWSSRPLSMILSDNVWLFNKKNRNSVEKAMNPSGGAGSRQIESAKHSQAMSAAPAPSHSASTRKSVERPSRDVTPVKTATKSVETMSENQKEPKRASASAKEDAPPFLTLNLDSSTQRLDVPEQYLDESVISEEFYSQTGSSSEPEQTPESDLPESVLGPLTGLTVNEPGSSVRAGRDSAKAETVQSSAPSATPHAAPIATPVAVPIEVPTLAKSASASPDLVFSDHSSEPASQQNSSLSTASAARESTIDSSQSGSSVATMDATTRRNSFVLGSNRKVVVGRGVYIFDPAEPSAVRELQLTAAESFNPFEFD